MLAFFYFHNKIGKKAAAVAPDADIRYVALFKRVGPFSFAPLFCLSFLFNCFLEHTAAPAIFAAYFQMERKALLLIISLFL